MTAEGREELRRRAREAERRQKEAADAFGDFLDAMVAELAAGGDDPVIDPIVVKAMGAANVHLKAADVAVAAHQKSLVLALFRWRATRERQALAERIVDASRAGEDEAMRSCRCPKCTAKRKEADDAVAASLERARRPT